MANLGVLFLGKVDKCHQTKKNPGMSYTEKMIYPIFERK
jgi:hypothetical protein